jgi:hypothetical protein
MPTAKECRNNAEFCLKLAHETKELYARAALFELASEFRMMARQLDHEQRELTVRTASPIHRRRRYRVSSR